MSDVQSIIAKAEDSIENAAYNLEGGFFIPQLLIVAIMLYINKEA